jgi:hypothetical protein
MKALRLPNNSKANQKSLANHLLRAGLITSGQLKLAICEHHLTQKSLSEIVIDRGWVKEHILEDLANRLMGVSFKSARYREYRPTFEVYAA